tara:strand:+ start:5282 stop:7558 length:2277 start_codon:yes stop_codon:yes gene_type:complete
MATSNVTLIVNAAQAVNPLRQVTAETKKLEGATRDVNGRLRDVNGRFVATGQSATKTSRAFGGLKNKVVALAAAYVGLNAAQNAIKSGIDRIESERRIEFLAKGYGEVASLQNAATKAAKRFGTGQTSANQALADVFARLRPIGVSLEDIVSVYNGFNTAARISGSSAVESASAFRQLSQALGSGALRGDEFNSISEQVPGILTAISQESGVAQGNLRDFAAEGGITSDIVIRALKRIETEGASQLSAALGGPAQAIQDFQNASEEVQVALTKTIVPEMARVFTGLAELIINLKGPIEFIGGVTAGVLQQINSLITQATKPAAFAARKDIEAGLIPTNLVNALTFRDPQQGAKELFGEAEFNKLSQRAREFAKLRGQGFQQTLLQFMQDRLKTMDAAGQPPSLVSPVIPTFLPPGGKTSTSAAAVKPDMSQKLFDLNSRLLGQEGEITELEKLSLEFQIAKQKILENDLKPREEAIELLRAEVGFEEQLLGFRQKGIDAEEKQRQKAEKERQKMEAAEKKRRESDPGFQMQKQLDELLKLENQVAAGATAIGSAFSNAFVSVVTGSKSAKEALADMMSAVAEHFMDMAAQIIAKQLAMILYGTIMKALGVSGGNMGGDNFFDPLTGKGVAGPNFGLAEGGYVSSPTNALIGEGGEPEYVIPESKMRTAMSRYSRGSRGNSVIPESGATEAMGEGGGTAVAAPIDVRYTVERINSVDYVTADQFQAGMQQAAQQGAKQGEQQTLKRLQMSGSTRKRIGI